MSKHIKIKKFLWMEKYGKNMEKNSYGNAGKLKKWKFKYTLPPII